MLLPPTFTPLRKATYVIDAEFDRNQTRRWCPRRASSLGLRTPPQDSRVPKGPAFEASVGHHGKRARRDLERQLGEAADTPTAALARRTATGRGLPPGDQAHRPRVRGRAGRRPERTRVRDRPPRRGAVERSGDPVPGRPR